MNSFMINVNEVENLQDIKDIDGLERIFTRAKSAIVNGALVILARNQKQKVEKFDEISTLEDLEQYRKSVFKYLD